MNVADAFLVAGYWELEKKIEAIVKNELAKEIPLVK